MTEWCSWLWVPPQASASRTGGLQPGRTGTRVSCSIVREPATAMSVMAASEHHLPLGVPECGHWRLLQVRRRQRDGASCRLLRTFPCCGRPRRCGNRYLDNSSAWVPLSSGASHAEPVHERSHRRPLHQQRHDDGPVGESLDLLAMGQRERSAEGRRHHNRTADACAGWLGHPWLKARGRAVDTAPGHRASARCDRAASVGGSWRL